MKVIQNMSNILIRLILVLAASVFLSCENGLYDMADDLDRTVPICVDGDNGSDTNDGRGWGSAVATIGQALTLVSSGGDIWVKDITSGYTVSASITVDKPVKIYGGFNGTEGELSERPAGAQSEVKSGGADIFTVSSSGVIIANIIFSQASGYGRAINCQSGSSVVIENCDFNGLTVTGVNGGALYLHETTLSIKNCNFTGNTTNESGGAIYSDNSIVEITGSTFSTNTATGDTVDVDGGGAIYSTSGSSLTINNCEFNSNGDLSNCQYGGAIYARGGSEIIITGSTFDGNKSNGKGGAILFWGCLVDIYDSDFTGNQCNSTGGAMFMYGYGFPVSVLTDVSIWRCVLTPM